MGLDPQTHQPLASPHNPNDKAHASSSTSTRHMAQWETARLEAEARLSRVPHFNNKTDSDYFLRIWNSEVGESFRDVHKSESSIKCESLSATTTTTTTDLASSTPASIVKKEFLWGVKKIVSDSSSSSSELEHDSCDTSLQFLLDFPMNNDMSFLELWDTNPSLPLISARMMLLICWHVSFCWLFCRLISCLDNYKNWFWNQKLRWKIEKSGSCYLFLWLSTN